MSLLSDDDIAEAAQRREVFRERSVSTRLTRKETRNLDALAKSRGVQRGELIRQLIRDELGRDAGTSAASTELTEIMGIRLMLTNLFRPLATGQKLTPEAFDNMVAEVKKRKRSVAEDALQDLERA
ncbi:ribbon-helix-helix protein, CopG family [Granulicella sp. S156]|uniref:ribbon-helix-helix protein, CopG family n=1 Tax=Granulicella sp. S156 TaxID=1747224 RepID=UPI00131BDE7E|nr:ribbon-helix-helix protein, CopG family [Granulicella sp. S156]